MVDWGDVPTWVTAGVALAALVAAVRAYQDQSAGLAKQAEAVELQRQQLTDQTRLQEREQANAVDVELRSIDGAQAQVLSLDKSEPVPMLVVTNSSKRPVRSVSCKLSAIGGDDSVDRLEHASAYGVMALWAANPEAYVRVTSLGMDINPGADFFVFVEHASTMPVLKAGQKGTFMWGLAYTQNSSLRWLVRFTDDAGLHWEIDTDLHLKKLAKRDW